MSTGTSIRPPARGSSGTSASATAATRCSATFERPSRACAASNGRNSRRPTPSRPASALAGETASRRAPGRHLSSRAGSFRPGAGTAAETSTSRQESHGSSERRLRASVVARRRRRAERLARLAVGSRRSEASARGVCRSRRPHEPSLNPANSADICRLCVEQREPAAGRRANRARGEAWNLGDRNRAIEVPHRDEAGMRADGIGDQAAEGARRAALLARRVAEPDRCRPRTWRRATAATRSRVLPLSRRCSEPEPHPAAATTAARDAIALTLAQMPSPDVTIPRELRARAGFG